ncbi:hypothetical protein SAMN05216174_11132 [Actinokineospora iranica]|uniref:Uncharacterized protein n=2 Tax=Actinokineospora iranica TaxID=1271860 RepID=A0A1G6UPK3_9PSEU|nr:hypothetical protein SAMN05216174_11132 [Actinokineospora iranica]
MPTAAEAADSGHARTDAPRVVRVAFWVWVSAGLIGLIGSILFFILREEWAENQKRVTPEMKSVDVMQVAVGLSWWLLLGSLMFLGLFLLLAHHARRGARKARTLLLVVGVIACLFEYSFGRVTIYGLISALLVIVGLGMLYMPTARRFFAESDER